MKIYVISDNEDTLIGLRLAGIEGEVAHTKEAFMETLDRVSHDDTIGLVLMSTSLVTSYHQMMIDIKKSKQKPLFLEIPDRHGPSDIKDNIETYISDALGVVVKEIS